MHVLLTTKKLHEDCVKAFTECFPEYEPLEQLVSNNPKAIQYLHNQGAYVITVNDLFNYNDRPNMHISFVSSLFGVRVENVEFYSS